MEHRELEVVLCCVARPFPDSHASRDARAGKSFFKKKKQPVPVRLVGKDWAGQVAKALGCTYFFWTGATAPCFCPGLPPRGEAFATKKSHHATMGLRVPVTWESTWPPSGVCFFGRRWFVVEHSDSSGESVHG